MKRYLTLTIMAAGVALSPAPAFSEALEGKRTVAEILGGAEAADWRALDQDQLLYIELERGTAIVALSSAMAQGHVEQMKALAREGFYDGLSFYRVIDGFVAQGGDVFEKRTMKNAKKALKAEFEQPLADITFDEIESADGYAPQVGFVDAMPAGRDPEINSGWLLHCTGAVAMARDVAKDTGGTEIYVTLQPQRYLDRNLSVFGRVVDGMEHVQALRRVAPPESEDDDLGETILSVRVGSDLPKEKQKHLKMLRTDTDLFSDYVEARRNRASDFFYHRPDYVDICQIPLPVEEVVSGNAE